MTTSAVYCDNDPGAAQWTRNLVARGLVAPGEVIERSIADVQPEEVRRVPQAHFFSGIAAWSRALRLAGWPDDCEVWTGSPPCQPFSNAGRKRASADERHLWPEYFRLIRECRPPVVLVEQVASPAGRAWLDAVLADLEGADYACGAAFLPACSVGAPHQRERLYLVALADGERLEGVRLRLRERRPRPAEPEARGGGEAGGLADAQGQRHHGPEGHTRGTAQRRRPGLEPEGHGAPGVVADGGGAGRQGRAPRARGRDGTPGDGEVGVVGDAGRVGGGRDAGAVPRQEGEGAGPGEGARRFVDVAVPAGPTRGHWHPCRWVLCRDGKARPVELPPLAVADGAAAGVAGVRSAPSVEDAYDTFPLSVGEVGRTARLRGYGNAIVAPLAAEFISSVIDVLLEL